MNKLWFAAKRYGWGWYPVTWQGWVVLLAYILVVAGIVTVFQSHLGVESPIWFIVKIAIVTGILIGICWKTGEKPRWRWGK